MDDDGELKNLINVWTMATISLCYCYYVASRIPRGILRLISLLPVIFLFLLLPLSLNSVHLIGITSFFLVWLATFKLLLFSWDQGPLSRSPQSPPINNVFHFISIACLPIKLQTVATANNYIKPKPKPTNYILINWTILRLPSRSLILLVIKAMFLALILYGYNYYKHHMHPHLLLILLCLHLYLELEILLAICATPARILFGFQLQPQFNAPFLSTSLQDFWGRRWNLMVTSILRPTVYLPVQRYCARVTGRPTLASFPAIIATFLVSGLMHELIYYYVTRVCPTWEVTCFFVLHGVFVAIEAAAKKAVVADKWQLPPQVSTTLTAAFLAVTGFWLFFPQIIRNDVYEKVITELFTVLSLCTQLFNSMGKFPFLPISTVIGLNRIQ